MFWFGFLYTQELWILKSAFLAQFWGLFDRVQTRIKYVLHAIIAYTAASWLSVVGVYLGACRPFERN